MPEGPSFGWRPPWRAIAILVAAWLALVGSGSGALYAYSTKPGAGADAPARWPSSVPFEPSINHHTLVMIAHPKCSCTRATIAELARLLRRLSSRLEAHVLFVIPPGVESGFQDTDLYHRTARIPGVTVHDDPGGVVAERFGAKTSGQVLLFGIDRKLRFAGGLTPSRSHEGDSVGKRRIIELVESGETDRGVSDVYGCELWAPSTTATPSSSRAETASIPQK